MYPHEKSTSTSRSRSFWAALLLSFAGLALVNHIQAQPGPTSASSEKEVGTIRGVVSQSETGQYLEGVVVRLVERNFTVLTDREGNFEFRNLPEGNYTVSANYTGLDTQTVAVAVARNETAVKRVELSSADTYTLEKITVAGTREGNAAAITRQRNAANVVNVVSMDAYGNVADGNIGNFMQKLPGISTVVENGDIVGVNIRGTPSELNSLSVDGTRAASAYAGFNPQGDRAAPVDQIPADSVKEIEVIKALTPDLPADSLGGIVNVVTKSALDYNRPLFTYRLGANHNTYREGNDRWTPTGSISYISKFGKKERVGLAVSTSYSETTNTRERMTTSRIEADARPTSGSALDDVVTRIRAGAALKVDLQASDSTRLWLSLNHNYFSFHSVRFNQNFAAGGSRRIADYNVVSRAQIEAGATPRTTTNQTAGLAPGFSDDLSELLAPTYLNRTAAGTRQSRQYKAEIGATSELSNEQKIAFRLSYNPTRYQNLFQGFDLRLNGPAVGVAIDSRDGRSPPMYYQTYGPSVGLGSDMGMYRAERFETPERSEEEVTNFRLDYEKGAKLGDHRSVFKAGINWRQQHRISQEVDGRVWNYVGADGVVGRNSVTGLNDDNLGQFLKSETGYTLFNNLYPKYDQMDYSLVQKAFLENPTSFVPAQRLVDTFNEITEDVYAIYVSNHLQVGKLGILGGVRMETTEVNAVGNVADPRHPDITSASVSSDYNRLFPSLHFRYALMDRLILRASYSTSYARAAFEEIYPITTVTYNSSNDLGQVTRNEVGIKPQSAQTYDVSAEYYFEPAGMVSISYYHKDIRDFIAQERRIIESGANNGFEGDYAGFDLVTARNFGEAKIDGYEVNYSQRLKSLPAPFNGITLLGNYTSLETAGNYGEDVDELVRFVPKTLNGGVSFEWRRLEARATYNYKGSFLNSYNANRNARQRIDSVETWDFNVQYRVNSKLTVFVDLINAFNKWPNMYTGTDRNRVNWSEVYGSRLNVGISGRF